MRLIRIPSAFDHPDFLFEPKLDGYRALAHVRGHRCELMSRNGYAFKQWPQLAEEVAHAIPAFSAVLDRRDLLSATRRAIRLLPAHVPTGRTFMRSMCSQSRARI